MPPPTGVPSWCRRGLPPEIVTALNAILTKALKAPEVQAAYGQQGMETLAGIRLE
jgi:tripartite-type tricarboxylate transporter receptor subunit TctC